VKRQIGQSALRLLIGYGLAGKLCRKEKFERDIGRKSRADIGGEKSVSSEYRVKGQKGEKTVSRRNHSSHFHPYELAANRWKDSGNSTATRRGKGCRRSGKRTLDELRDTWGLTSRPYISGGGTTPKGGNRKGWSQKCEILWAWKNGRKKRSLVPNCSRFEPQKVWEGAIVSRNDLEVRNAVTARAAKGMETRRHTSGLLIFLWSSAWGSCRRYFNE